MAEAAAEGAAHPTRHTTEPTARTACGSNITRTIPGWPRSMASLVRSFGSGGVAWYPAVCWFGVWCSVHGCRGMCHRVMSGCAGVSLVRGGVWVRVERLGGDNTTHTRMVGETWGRYVGRRGGSTPPTPTVTICSAAEKARQDAYKHCHAHKRASTRSHKHLHRDPSHVSSHASSPTHTHTHTHTHTRPPKAPPTTKGLTPTPTQWEQVSATLDNYIQYREIREIRDIRHSSPLTLRPNT